MGCTTRNNGFIINVQGSSLLGHPNTQFMLSSFFCVYQNKIAALKFIVQ